MKVRLVHLYEADMIEAVLLDEGQDFPALYAEFNAQDGAMCDERDEDGPAHRAWLSFTSFMESRGVKIVDHEDDHSYDPTACTGPEKIAEPA